MFGIDGATFDIILPAIRAGKLPHLQSLIEGGSWGRLQSTIHPITPMAWSSFATGVNAGKHGIFDFSRLEENRIRLNTAEDRKAPAIWTYLSRSRKSSIVLNVPFTYPTERIRGIMIPGFDTPRVERKIFYPEEIYDELIDKFGSYRLDWTFPVGQKFDIESYMSEVEETIRHRCDTSLHLLENHPWDFFMVVFTSVDHVQHIFWQHPRGILTIERTYQMVDQSLGKFLASLDDETTVIVMSDHGAGPINRIVYLDNWLANEAYLVRHPLHFRDNMVRKSKYYLRKMLSTQSRKRLRSLFPQMKNRLEGVEFAASIDWNQTQAFSYGMYGNIYLNLVDRNPHGIVETSRYERLCDEICTKLVQLEDPETGKRAVERIYRKEELYSGPYTFLAPDLIVQWHGYAYFTKRGIDKGTAVFAKDLYVEASDFPHTGTHRLDGVFISRGPHIRTQNELSARIIDIAPTVLCLLGEPLPSYLDGRVLEEIFDNDFIQTVQIRKQGPKIEIPVNSTERTSLSGGEDQKIREMLKSLGYID